MKKLLSLLALMVILSSCEKEIDYKIPDPGDKIVVSGQLVSGKAPKIYLSTSVYSMEAGIPKTSNIYSAKLFTNDPNSPFELEAKLGNSSFDSVYYYTSAHIIGQAKTYRLEVSAPNLDPVSASTLVPPSTAIASTRYDTATKELRFSFNDQPNNSDYYFIQLIHAGQNYPLYFSSADPTLEFFEFSGDPFGGEGEGRSYGSAAFFDDNQFKGMSKEVNIRIEDYINADFYIYLHSISESYYRFRLTEAAGGFSDGFFSEPVQLFSNVEGGYGIITGQSSDSVLIRY